MARCYPLKGLLRRRFFKSGPEFGLAKQLGDPHVQNDAVSNPDLDGRAICTLKLWSISRSILRVDVGNLKVTKGEAFTNLPRDSLRPRLALWEGEQNPKGETNWNRGSSSRSSSVLLSSVHGPGNESGNVGSTEGAGAVLLQVQSLTGDMHGPLGRLEPPATKGI